MRLIALSTLLALGCSHAADQNDGGSDGSVTNDATPDVASDAPPSDSGNNDAGVCGPYKYCDDFESYAAGAITNTAKLGPWVATVNGLGIAMTVDAVNPYKSSQSLHVTVPSNAGMDAGGQARGTLNQKAAGGLVPGNDLYGRAMVFYSNTGANNLAIGVHSWIFNASGISTAADGGVTLNLGGGGAKLQLNYHPPLPGLESSADNGNITAGAWHCVQWQYNGSGTPPADVAKVWVDGAVQVMAAAPTYKWDFATPWDSFDFGFTHYQLLQNPVDIFLDDFALDGAMIPCPP